MLTWIRSHLGVVAVAAVVLAVAMTSSATAALKITGKDIKNETVTTKDVKNGALEAVDLSAAAKASLQGAPGAPGAPPFVGSACTVPGVGAGTITMQVAANGTVTLICAVPAAPGQNADLDNDGYQRSQECNDTKPAVHPGVDELAANLFDDDCDGVADDGLDSTDHDGDGTSIMAGDCDDTNTLVTGVGPDAFGDGLDEDCDGVDG